MFEILWNERSRWEKRHKKCQLLPILNPGFLAKINHTTNLKQSKLNLMPNLPPEEVLTRRKSSPVEASCSLSVQRSYNLKDQNFFSYPVLKNQPTSHIVSSCTFSVFFNNYFKMYQTSSTTYVRPISFHLHDFLLSYNTISNTSN